MVGPSKYYEPNKLAAAKPTRVFFDPWNSSGTGHQRAENRLSSSTSWRDSRNYKLADQFASGQGGGKRLADTVGAGSKGWKEDGRHENGSYARGASGLREDSQKSIRDCWFASGASVSKSGLSDLPNSSAKKDRSDFKKTTLADISNTSSDATRTKGGVFEGLVFYINGSTYPMVSDHKLKRLIAEHGGRLTIALGRRKTTHVILGRTNASAQDNKVGAGGGLASSKIHKEVTLSFRGQQVRYITVDWVLESIKAGVRLSEVKYAPLKLAAHSQSNVSSCFSR